MSTSAFRSIGFIGLGVMGEPICRNLARKTQLPVIAHDLDAAPLQRLAQDGVRSAGSIAQASAADIVFLSLPSGEVVDQVCRGAEGLLAHARAGQFIVDLSTSAVATTRALAADFARHGAHFIDAPVARTRAAAEAGTLSVMVGAQPEAFAQVRPLIESFATEISLCGPSGCGQVLKILNNMVLFETVMALSEASAIANRAGVDTALLFEVLAKGSADSFALRNHGMKAIQTGDFPERAFSVRYAQKDLRYALQLARDSGISARAAHLVDQCFDRSIAAGDGDRYHPVISRIIEGDAP